MKTQIRKLLDDRIDILNRNTVDVPPVQQVFKSVSTTPALIRVSSLAPYSSMDSHWRSNQDKLIDNKDSIQLSEYCFNVCVALETPIRGKNADDLNESVRVALEDPER